MKKSFLSLLLLTCVCTGMVQAQGQAPQTGHRIGLVDLGKIVKDYSKFAAMQKSMEAEVAKIQAELNGKGERLQKLVTDAKRFEPSTPQYEAAEKAILEARGDIEAYKAAAQRKAARRESEMLRDVYTDITEAVGLYAGHYKLDFVMKYNSQKATDSMTPQETFNLMQNTFLYTKQGHDITPSILKYLNDKYSKSGGNTSAVRPASNTRPRQ